MSVKIIWGSDVGIETNGKQLTSYAVAFTDENFSLRYKKKIPRENSLNPWGMQDEKKEITNQRSIKIYSRKFNDNFDSYYFIFKGDETDAITNSHDDHIRCVIMAPDIETADKILQKAAKNKVIIWEDMKPESETRYNRYGYGGGSTHKKRAKKSYKKSRRTRSKSRKARRSFK